MQEIVYKIPGKNAGPKGKTYDWKGVKSADELNQALKDGWFNTLEEAVKGKSVKLVRAREEDGQYKGDDPSTPGVNEAYIEDSAPTRAEMEAKAKELRISFKRRTSDKDLLALIEAKIKG